MGQYKVIISERAQKNLLTIQKSGDKASIKKSKKSLPNSMFILKRV